MFAAVTLKKDEKKRIWDTYFPWAIRNGLQSKEVINIYWEEELETDVVALRERLGIEMPPEYVPLNTGPRKILTRIACAKQEQQQGRRRRRLKKLLHQHENTHTTKTVVR